VAFKIIVQAKDSYGINLNSGGDLFYADFRNKWSWTNKFTWDEPVGSINDVIDIPYRAQMTDMGDGTYERMFITSKQGKMTISVFLYDPSDRVIANYYNCPTYKGNWLTPLGSQFKSQINENYYQGNIYPGTADNIKTIFETTLLPMDTKSYTLTIYGDDYAIVYLDGVQIIESEWGVITTDIATMTLDANRPYYLKVVHEEKDLYAKILFSWDDTGILAAIPSANFGYPQEVETINITSQCPAFTTLSGGACITPLIWGDGLRAPGEACDDGNTSGGDGWSADWTIIESGFTWIGGSPTSRDVCIDYFQSATSDEIKTANVVASSIIASGAFVNFLTILLSVGSSQSLFSGTNQLQLMLLLPLFRLYMPKPIVDFYRELSWTLMSFDFLKVDFWPGVQFVSKSFSKEQSDPYLNLIGISNYSSIMNVMQCMLLIAMFLLIHAFISFWYLAVKGKTNLTWTQKLIKNLFRAMTFNIYVRIIIEAFLIAAISTYSELKTTRFGGSNTSYTLSIVSFAFSIAIVVILHLTILLNVYELWKLRDTLIIEDDSYFTEFFSGLKEDNLSRTFNVGNMIRRSLLALWVVVFTFLPGIAVIVVFSLCQFAFTIYTLYLHPFVLKRDSLRECINEIMFFSFSSTHIYFNSESTWNETYAWIYVGVVMSNILTGSIISISWGIADLVKKWRLKRRKNKTSNCYSNKIYSNNNGTQAPDAINSSIIGQSMVENALKRTGKYKSSTTLSGIEIINKKFSDDKTKKPP
jgi:cysteine-rich repeat protein